MKICFRLLALVISLQTVTAMAQQNCGMVAAYEELFRQDPSARALFNAVTGDQLSSKTSTFQPPVAGSYTIPVVFHILHKAGSENISDAQIQDAVAILNRDFRKQNGDTLTIVPEFKAVAADCKINFQLASIDPDGKCTNGITRHYDDRTNWDMQDYSNFAFTWPRHQYLNIYVVRSFGNGTAGYTFLPGTVGPAMDAIVILHSFVGSIGTANNSTSRALTHEVGHWLNLQHVWGSNNNPGFTCGDDGVGDTPVTKGHSFCNLNNAIDCTPMVVENIQNYMEYAYCSNMFTQGQSARMNACLNSAVAGRNNLCSYSNLFATGVVNPMGNCAPKAEFYSDSYITCVGNSLSFVDYSYNAPVSAWQWSSPLAAGISTVQNGQLNFNTAGFGPIKLKVSNGFGSDSLIRQYVTVLGAATPPGDITLSEGFEIGVFTSNGWLATTPKYGSAFTQTTSAAATGSTSIWVNNYQDSPSEPVVVYSPAFNLKDAVSALLSFKYAYAQLGPNSSDALKLYISTSCGSDWTEIYSNTGGGLKTTLFPVQESFIPVASEWQSQTISLQPFSGNNRVYFKFEFTPDPAGPGNNFYLDDINLNTVVGINENMLDAELVKVYPNPFSTHFLIENKSGQKIESVKLFDVSMRLVHQEQPAQSNTLITVQTSTLVNGVYFAELRGENGCRMIKLVKE